MKKLKLVTAIEDSYDELRFRTSWPTRTQVVKSALIVMVASLIIALIVWLMDIISESVMKLLYNI